MGGVIGIDLDGVLADSVSKWLQYAEKEHGIKALKKDIIRYEISEVFTSLTHEEVLMGFKEIWKDYHAIGMESQDIPTILDNLRDKFEIYITTLNKNENVRHWLKDNKIAYQKLIVFDHHYEKHKLEEVSVYIDDFPEVITSVAKVGKTGILLRQPWNEEFAKEDRSKNIRIADGWRQVEEILLDIK